MSESSFSVGIQIGDSKPETHSDLSIDDLIGLVSKADDRMSERIKATEQRLQAVREEVIADPDLAVEYYQLQLARSKADDLLSCDLRDYNPEEQVQRVDRYHRYTELGSALLYADTNFRGSSKFFSVTWPNFKWWPYKFNDKASSAKVWGANILFQDTWYGGRRLYLIGLPFAAFPDLGVFDFNDTASSFVSIP